MKTLQNNFTTPEQSKRLLELGVPVWTADCYYYEENGISKDCTPNIVSLGDVWTDESKETMFSSYVDVPCWSVGRLIEIFELCSGVLWQDTAQPSVKQPTLIERVIDTIVLFNKHGNMDFSKLED